MFHRAKKQFLDLPLAQKFVGTDPAQRCADDRRTAFGTFSL